LPPDLSKLNRLALVDMQRRNRIGPTVTLLEHANRVVIVDHHVDMESDIQEATNYVVDKVGSVLTLIVERLMKQQREQQLLMVNGNVDALPFTLTEAEATLLALGIHADTGSLCFDSTTPRDATALAWVMSQGASQVAIAEHPQSSLSQEQQVVLTQALIKTSSTVAHEVTILTVLLTADGLIGSRHSSCVGIELFGCLFARTCLRAECWRKTKKDHGTTRRTHQISITGGQAYSGR
jgi:tRNA nucleotidyltransferase (CCA-adding enzyme)